MAGLGHTASAVLPDIRGKM